MRTKFDIYVFIKHVIEQLMDLYVSGRPLNIDYKKVMLPLVTVGLYQGAV